MYELYNSTNIIYRNVNFLIWGGVKKIAFFYWSFKSSQLLKWSEMKWIRLVVGYEKNLSLNMLYLSTNLFYFFNSDLLGSLEIRFKTY